MKAKITLKTVGALPSTGTAFLWDTSVAGFGVKATRAGATYVLQYRMGGRGAKTNRYTIGRHGSPWTPETARKEALAILRKVADGIDPAQEKRIARRPTATTEVVALFGEFIEKHHKARGNRYWPEHQ